MLLLTFHFSNVDLAGVCSVLVATDDEEFRIEEHKIHYVLKNKLSSLINTKSNFKCVLEPVCIHAGEEQKQYFRTTVFIWHCWKSIIKFLTKKKMKKKNPSKKINNFYVKSTHVQNERSREDDFFLYVRPYSNSWHDEGEKRKKKFPFSIIIYALEKCWRAKKK